MAERYAHSLRARIRAILEGEDELASAIVGGVINALIAISAVAISLETVPSLPAAARRFLLWLEFFVSVVFALEYALRVWAARRPLRYVFGFWGIVDLLAFAPTLLAGGEGIWGVVRVLRLIKLVRHWSALDRLVRALIRIRDDLLVFLSIAALLIYVAAVGIYHFEHEVQPEAFSSIPASLWWAIATFTTVGYGDVYPVTAGGKIFTAIILIIGLGVVAVPTGLISAALIEELEAERRRRDARRRRSRAHETQAAGNGRGQGTGDSDGASPAD